MACDSNNSKTIVQQIDIDGKQIYLLIDGGKGIGFTNGTSAGLWAKAGGIGTFSAAAADYYDANDQPVLYTFKSKTRIEKHEELIMQEIQGAIDQARLAYTISEGKGLVNLNILWEMGGTERILEGALPACAQYLYGLTAGAGMPYNLGAIAAKHGLHFLPIVSSVRAFRVLWTRAYAQYKHQLAAIVYEDPWKAGGHNGLSSQENPLQPQDPYERVRAIRDYLHEIDMSHVPIIIAGNVWHLHEWTSYIHDPYLQPLGFQFGTRTLVTIENPSQLSMKQAFLSAGQKQQKVHLHKFSPTGFYSSALENSFLTELIDRSNRQVAYARAQDDVFSVGFELGQRKTTAYFKPVDAILVQKWIEQGYSSALPTPDQTFVFVDQAEATRILQDQRNCKGCLKGCRFSNWYEKEPHTTGILPDPRSFCIYNTLYAASHGGDVEHNLMFAGHTVHRFSSDPFYANAHIPTVQELFNRILTGY